MQSNTRSGMTRFGQTRVSLFAFMCIFMLATGCSKSDQSNVALDTSRLPRVTGAKEIFASALSTIFTSPVSVVQTADIVDKALAAEGWQKYVAPHTSSNTDPNIRLMSLKKGSQGLGVFITVAPAQGNATSVNYSAVALKNDLPFPKDASEIEFDPNQTLLTLVTTEPIDKTLDLYRKELSTLGWSLWSQKLNGVQPAGGTAGELTKSGAYAYYIQDDRRLAALVLEHTEAGRTKVKFEELPAGYLETLQKEYFNSDNTGAALVDVNRLPRLDGAKELADRSSSDRLDYSVPGTLPNTVAATKKLLAVDGWKQYVGPLEEEHETLMFFKKGPQGLSVSFTISVGKTSQTTDQTTVYYSPTRLRFALAIPDDATDIVFDENRPYLNCVTAGTIDATQDFYRKELGALGWSPLSATDAAKQWPNAKLDEKNANGISTYYIRGTQRPISLSLQRREDNKTSVEIKVPSFAEPQVLEAGREIYGLPIPKVSKTAGGNPGDSKNEVFAHVPAEVGTVLAFYRRELAARNWKEETAGAVLNPDDVTLNFSSPEGTAALKLSHKYDFTVVSLVLLLPKPIAKVEPAAKADSVDDVMREMQQMMREATADAMASQKSPAVAQPLNGPEPPLRVLAENKAPVPVPDTAEDVDFDGTEGTLEFESASSMKQIVEFFRTAMKPLGWREQRSVINKDNMVVLDLVKDTEKLSFTIMQMGPSVHVSARGPALVKQTADTGDTARPNGSATAPDLEVDDAGGLPIPKPHSVSGSERSLFRFGANANVPASLEAVLAFYRRELSKRDWKEQTERALIRKNSAELAFITPDGPAVLKLGRQNDETVVTLDVREHAKAMKSNLMPKSGRAMLLFGNMRDKAADITINNKTIKIAAGAGAKGPDGPTLELPPGKYKVALKSAGQLSQNDEVKIGADEIWVVMIGPGGMLAVQGY